MRAALIVAFCGTALPLRAQATAIPDVAVGARIRLVSSAVYPNVAVGRLRDANQGYVTMAIAPRTSIDIPWSQISSLSYVAGRNNEAGVAAGAVLGAALSLVVNPASLVFLPAGGATVGWFSGPERWQPISWRPATDTVMLEGEAPRLRIVTNTQIVVRTERAHIKGRVLQVTDDSLAMRQENQQLQLAWSDVSELHVRGRRNRVKGAALGFSLFGAAAAVQMSLDARTTRIDRRETALAGFLAASVLGAAIGTPGWSRIPFPSR